MIIFPLSTLASFVPFSSFQHIYFSVFLDMGLFSDFYLSVFFLKSVLFIGGGTSLISLYIYTVLYTIFLPVVFTCVALQIFGLLFIISCIDNDEIRL